MRYWAVLMIGLILTGCATVPAGLERGTFARITPERAQQEDSHGQRVRWGGSLVETVPGKDETCFEVVSRPLDEGARPAEVDRSEGRFIACLAGFYDPAVYQSGREVTVIGTIDTVITKKIGAYDYRFPKIRGEVIHLWPKREPREAWPPYYYDPWWPSPWGPWPYGPRRW